MRDSFEWVKGLFGSLLEPVDRSEQLYFLELMSHVRNSADAVFTKLAGEIAESGVYKDAHFLRPEVCVGFVGGMSLSDAHKRVDTARRLRELPELAGDFAEGLVSFDQAAMVAEGAELDPSAYSALLDHARVDSHEQLRRTLNKVKAATSSPADQEAAARKVHLRQPGGDQFGKGLTGYLLNEQSAVLNAVLDPIADRIFREKWKDGTFISREHCNALALVEMAKLASGGAGKGPRPHINLVVSLEALTEQHLQWDQLCDVQGVGPVPMKRIKELLNDAYINLVVTGAPSEVSDKYRPNAAMKRHLDANGRVCTLLGCDGHVGLDRDHNQELRDNGETSVENLDDLCGGHHRNKTKYRMKLVGPRGRKQFVKLTPEEMYGGARAGPNEGAA